MNEENIEEDPDLNTDELDSQWIHHFEEIDKNYADFYLEDVSSIKVQFIYINEARDIQKVKREKIMLQSPNILSREELLSLLQKNMTNDNSSYFLSVILKYNITLESNEIRKYCTSNYSPTGYITRVNTVDTIPFQKTITMFQDLNHLFFLFIEKQKTNTKNKTKRNHYLKIGYNRTKTTRK